MTPTKTKEKMTCPDCGVELNQHAAKLVEPRNAREAAQMDSALGALILEGHSCPKCGTGASRRSR
jgi:ribosomal protein S27AE